MTATQTISELGLESHFATHPEIVSQWLNEPVQATET